MSDSGCVVGWYPDENVKGVTNLKPLVCKDLIDSLTIIIGKMALRETLSAEEKDIVVEIARGRMAQMAEEYDEIFPQLKIVRDHHLEETV